MRLIDVASPLMAIIPEVELPYEEIPFDDKIMYTLIVTLIYIFGQFPLAGVAHGVKSVKDPLYFVRGVFAAEPYTLMEFGIFPPVATGLIMQVLAGLKVIKVNFKVKRDRELFQSTVKLFSLIQYVIFANIFIFSGYYGHSLSLGAVLALNLQLVGAGMFALLLIEIIDKGYGLGSGVMAIIAVSASTNFVCDSLGITQVIVDSAKGVKKHRGALINLIQGFRFKDKNLLGVFTDALQRDYLPNLTTMIIVLAIAATVGFLQNVRIELAIRSTKARGMNNVFPVSLFYTSGMSILFSYSLLFYLHIVVFAVVQLVGENNSERFTTSLFGKYTAVNDLFYVSSFPVSLFSPPRSIFGLFRQPLSIIFFTMFLVSTGVWFATHWQEISGSSSFDISTQLKEQSITLIGRREQSVSKELEKVIPIAAITGAVILALITSLGELLGLKGAAAGIVVGLTSAFSLLEIIGLEYQQNGGRSTLAQVLGGTARA